MSDARPLTPIHVLTGFLGSGKTTLLQHLLRHEEMSRTAVVINELGEIGLDHALVREVTEEVVLLASGCVCCSVREDLAATLEELKALAGAGRVPPFERLVVETTGLADPAPLIQTIVGSRALGRGYRLAGVTATVDAVLGQGQLDSHIEALKQAATADCLVITKTDLADPASLAALRDRLARINPAVRPVDSAAGRLPTPEQLFDPAGSYDTGRMPALWFAAPLGATPAAPGGKAPAAHDERIGTFALRIERPLEWDAFAEWLELILASRGENLLRMKGVVNVAGRERPTVVQCVQHMAFPPAELSAWPDADRATRLVFITRDLTRRAVENSLREILGDIVP